jgi:cell division septation protein DedD
MKWKGRGYEVSLKPVARPSGVIYRLYLGSFSSESQADELVRHLKSKEGISALRLVLHN